MGIKNLTSPGWQDYELLDSGGREKLERFGNQHLIRFEPAAVWKPALGQAAWAAADARFTLSQGKSQGLWTKKPGGLTEWTINLSSLKINLSLRTSRHVGIFPEQLPNWLWLEEILENQNREVNALNLFAYTGVATVFAAKAGARVTHVDSSKSAVATAAKNLEASGLASLSVRWLVDDVSKFLQRELRRGSRYDAIIMDPPKFGRGPGGEVWKFENAIGELMKMASELLSDNPLLMLVTAYNVNTSPDSLCDLLEGSIKKEGNCQCGELIQKEKSAGRMISQSIYARWVNTIIKKGDV